VARDGEEALARAETLEPDVALLDIGLPGMLGHELAGPSCAATLSGTCCWQP